MKVSRNTTSDLTGNVDQNCQPNTEPGDAKGKEE